MRVCVQVMKTLGGAEQVCEELQQSVSSLDERLAELQHCEIEARELYQLLKQEWKHSQNQDPRARVSTIIDWLILFTFLPLNRT